MCGLKMADNQVISVTVNNGSASSTSTGGQIRNGRQLVTITPLPPGCRPPCITPVPHSLTTSRSSLKPSGGPTTCRVATQAISSSGLHVRSQGQKQVEKKLDKVLLKATCKGKMKEYKTFTLRNVDTAAIVSSHGLKKLIKESLHDDISSRDFDIGYMQGSNVIRVRTAEDMSEMWSEVKKQGMLWCDGLLDAGAKKSGRKGKYVSDEDSDDEPPVTQHKKKKKKPDNEAKVQEIIDDLKSKYGTQYTIMQLRIWAELIAGGLYSSTSDPPDNSMFQRAGGSSSGPKKKDQTGTAFAQALSEAATAITCALSGPAKTTPGHGAITTSSPAKLIDSRSKLYKQLSELQNLRSMGILTDAEYATEKETIMSLLKELKSR